MKRLKSILSSRSILYVLSIGAASSCAVYYYPSIGRIASSVAINTVPIACGVLIGAVSVLATVLMVIYPALSDRRASLGSKYHTINAMMPSLTSEIKEDTVVSVVLAALILILHASTQVDRIDIFDEHVRIVQYLYSDAMVVASVVIFMAALDVVRTMFTLFSIVHTIYAYDKDKT